VKGRLLFANWLTANFAALATPLFYAARRVTLNRQHGAQVSALKKFAGAGTEQLSHEPPCDDGSTADAKALEAAGQNDWPIVLGVSPAATLDEVKQAYKGLIKKNHPDRVSDMSPSFVKLAEAETKRLNVAYAEALSCLQR
jgi:DnaJ-domain-containing protein 1